MSDHPDGMPYLLSRVHELHDTLPASLSFLEVGSYQGDTTCDILRILGGTERWMFTLDPYGGKPYLLDGRYWDADATQYHDLTYRRAMLAMAQVAVQHNANHAYYRMTSLDFFKLVREFDFWCHGQKYPVQFGFAYLDGAHEPDTVRQEVAWLLANMPVGMIVIDDWHHVDTLAYDGLVMNDRCYISVR